MSKHRIFCFLPSGVGADGALNIIGSADAFVLGCLSSGIHLSWALAAGGRMGVGNDPRYNKNRCFDAFPFPASTPDLRSKIGAIAERLDKHRTDALARDERVTMTGMYNVVEKLRSGETLTVKERAIHEITACGVLKDIHDELDAAVAEAYGWPWPMPTEEILERLVALHDERVEEEKRGLIRWLRPDFQIPRFGAPEQPAELELIDAPIAKGKKSRKKATEPTEPAAIAWPHTAVDQLTLIGAALAQGPQSPDALLKRYAGSKRDLVSRHLDTLVLLGEARLLGDGSYQAARRT